MSSFPGYCKFGPGLLYRMWSDGWVIVTVRKVGVLLLAILTVTANHTKRNLQTSPGMTLNRSSHLFHPAVLPI